MGIRNKVIIKSRLTVLKRTVTEIIDGAYQYHKDSFRSYNTIMSTVEKGIDKQYLKKISFVGKNNQVIINKLVFEIDWRKYQIICNTSDSSYKFDENKSISSQVSGIMPVLSKFITNSLRSGAVDTIDVYYRLRSNIDQIKANNELGLVDLSSCEERELLDFEKQSFSVNVEPGRLEELSISFQSKVKVNF